ncbi:Alpha/beta hydrolase family protein [Caulifigura coniformis]|uniref:Alpha/beta hydrolase family protein n=1 Tax=Caulifigura coniformis TaxID=2527983 RepID=A0A517SIN9_9PLAN|nr:prolyl oligopeptidase family serine peptidase [Caulifigura coniformis]QDT55985.1 Alpha/beta hydrolase family protein [Caulifigura coniformis]
MTPLFLVLVLAADPNLAAVELQVDGVTREALIAIPEGASSAKPAPVVFAFHGHGGTMRNAARTFAFEKAWPDAVVVYMQGLKTATLRDPAGERPGWQNLPGQQGDRDVKAFDAFLAHVKSKTSIDDNRIYATGHSNGGGFTYALWGARPDLFAAIAPSSANPPLSNSLKPLPVFQVTGKTDAIVSYAGQTRTVDAVRRINRCEETGKSWATDCTEYPSPSGKPVIWMVHDGGHKYSADAPALIVRFFKEQTRKPAAANAGTTSTP